MSFDYIHCLQRLKILIMTPHKNLVVYGFCRDTISIFPAIGNFDTEYGSYLPKNLLPSKYDLFLLSCLRRKCTFASIKYIVIIYVYNIVHTSRKTNSNFSFFSLVFCRLRILASWVALRFMVLFISCFKSALFCTLDIANCLLF